MESRSLFDRIVNSYREALEGFHDEGVSLEVELDPESAQLLCDLAEPWVLKGLSAAAARGVIVRALLTEVRQMR